MKVLIVIYLLLIGFMFGACANELIGLRADAKKTINVIEAFRADLNRSLVRR